MLFLVLLSEEPEFNELRHALREDRQAYLDSIAQAGRLLAEGAFAAAGTVTATAAASPGDAIALPQGARHPAPVRTTGRGGPGLGAGVVLAYRQRRVPDHRRPSITDRFPSGVGG